MSILQLDPGAPPMLRAAAEAALVLHIGGASVALLAGPVALIARKGGRLHRVAGRVFFGSMLAMSGIGAVVAPMLGDPISGLAGAWTLYLTLTGWAAVARRQPDAGPFELASPAFALAVAATGLMLGRAGSLNPDGKLGGEPFQIAYVFASLALLAAVCDLRLVLRGGFAGAPRIARHLWRMGLALFIAAGSFAGQPKAQPEALRGSPLLFLPALAILAATLFWLVKVRMPPRRAAGPALGGGAVVGGAR